jgi:hypothetical protein
MRLFLVSLILAAGGVSLAFAGPRSSWVGGNCEVPAAAVAAPVYRWERHNDNDQWNLLRNGRQAGAWSESRNVFYARDGKDWEAAPSTPPVDPPVKTRAAKTFKAAPKMPTGCKYDELTEPVFRYGGKDVSAAAFFAGDVPAEEAKKFYVAFVGDEAFLSTAKSAVAPGGKFAGLTDKLLIGFFGPNDWQVQGVGYRKTGVSIFGPRDPKTGKARELSYQQSLDGLDVAVVAALRVPNPEYDPAKAPDLSKPQPKPEPDKTPVDNPIPTSATPGWLYAVLSALGVTTVYALIPKGKP